MSRILIVDDEESIRRSLAGILSDEGFETRAEGDGEAAAEGDAAAEEAKPEEAKDGTETKEAE